MFGVSQQRTVIFAAMGVAMLLLLALRFSAIFQQGPSEAETKRRERHTDPDEAIDRSRGRATRQHHRDDAMEPVGGGPLGRPTQRKASGGGSSFPHLRGFNAVQKSSQNRTQNDKQLQIWLNKVHLNPMDPISRVEVTDKKCIQARIAGEVEGEEAAAPTTAERSNKKRKQRELEDDQGTSKHPRYTRKYFDPSSPSGDEGEVPPAQAQRRAQLQPQAMCHLSQTTADPDLFSNFDEADEPKSWEYYVRGAGQCPIQRNVHCDAHKGESPSGAINYKTSPIKDPVLGAPFTAEERLVKGRALVLVMISSFDPLIRTPEWENMDYFLRMALQHSKTSTELYDGVDFVFYRIHGQAEVVTLCKERQNVRTLWVPPGPCDLCAHGRVLKYLGFRPEFSTKLPHFSVWPYKTVVVTNTGVRGPFLSPGSSEWIDVVSMAGQPTRPKYFFDDLSFTTVAGVHVDPRAGPGMDRIHWKNNIWPMPWHLQSYFLMIPLSSLAYYYRLFDVDTACVSDAKLGCILISELRTVFPFVEPCRNKLWLGPIDERRFQIHALAWGFTFNSRNDSQAVTKRYNLTELQTPGYMIDPCKAMFVKFGGEVFRMLHNEFRLAVSVLSRHNSLTLSAGRHRQLDPGLVEALFGRPTKGRKNKRRLVDQADRNSTWGYQTQCNILY